MSEATTTPFPFDWSTLPVWETVEALRPVGQQLALDFLADGKRPFLAPLLSDNLINLLAHDYSARQTIQPPKQSFLSRLLSIWQKINHARQRKSMQNRKQDESPQDHYTSLVNNIPLSSKKWRDRLAKAIKRAMYKENPQSNMPAFMWPFIGKLSWEQLDIQLQVADIIYQYLKPYYLFWPQFGDWPRVHVNVYWLLIMLAIPDSSPDQSSKNWYAATQLQEIAYTQIMLTGGWAGFWDQWLAWQAWHKWPAAIHLKPDSRRTVNQLPLFVALNAESNSQSSSQTTNISQLAQPDWESQMPEWFLHQYKDWQLTGCRERKREK